MNIIKAYHGTNGVFDRFEQSKARIVNDFWGGGVAYFTDDMEVAKTYAKSMARSKGGDRLVYEAALTLRKTFDVDHEFSGKELTKFFTEKTSEEFARGAGLMKLGVDKYSVLNDLEYGKMTLKGSDIFHGLSAGMNQTAKARKILEKMGYDSLRYNGGIQMDVKKHNVYLTYRADNIIIKNRYMIDSEGKEYLKK